jgi:hypothetical protein
MDLGFGYKLVHHDHGGLWMPEYMHDMHGCVSWQGKNSLFRCLASSTQQKVNNHRPWKPHQIDLDTALGVIYERWIEQEWISEICQKFLFPFGYCLAHDQLASHAHIINLHSMSLLLYANWGLLIALMQAVSSGTLAYQVELANMGNVTVVQRFFF